MVIKKFYKNYTGPKGHVQLNGWMNELCFAKIDKQVLQFLLIIFCWLGCWCKGGSWCGRNKSWTPRNSAPNIHTGIQTVQFHYTWLPTWRLFLMWGIPYIVLQILWTSNLYFLCIFYLLMIHWHSSQCLK